MENLEFPVKLDSYMLQRKNKFNLFQIVSRWKDFTQRRNKSLMELFVHLEKKNAFKILGNHAFMYFVDGNICFAYQ